ncbi:lysine transporter LysE [Pseudodesulfovibrio cashew]|uniref:Lysine transporter LysE n=1 Tax=Pseudodesulfovibrio cashew TaxID=2678688 RepID=A0A6I6JF20_9BACT|nr:LysE family translocator [Pseudodesulfovibrio cashew]QGY39680.1 lysine transporter LysE [Pseudodesulfovibrio cashew]
MTFTAWISLFAICLLGAMFPGPSLAVVVKNTLGGGKVNGVLTAWAHAMGIAGYAIVTLFGLTIVLKQSPTLFKAISIAGALYIAWLGVQALRTKGGIAAKLASGEKASYMESIRDGAMISVLNPKIGLFFIALFSQFIDPGVGRNGQLVTVMTPFVTDGLWYTTIVLILSNTIILDKLREKAHVIDKVTGVIFLLVAARIVFTA